MTSTPAPAPPATDAPPKRRRHVVVPAVSGAVTVLLLGAPAKGCESPAGGPVLSETAFREHVRHTQDAGGDAVRRLGIDPATVVDRKEMGHPSCKDDLGVDADGVTRDQPSVTWEPDFAGRAAYVAAVTTLREEWSARGMTVRDVPAPAEGEPGAGLPGVRATDDHGIELSLGPDWLSGEPALVADGGCVRHRGYLVDWE
ncbi:hypothetical protein ACFT5C_04320 [Streptomyces sp. NPDC057116]|uniref:hypothetical protein n=1 Tax=Streptomyces sp. NPDC057116 TaxID=3346023 RepID=UPI00363D5797